MIRPVLTAAAALAGLFATSALAQTTRDYAAIYGSQRGPAANLAPQQDVTTTVGTGPAARYAKPQPGSQPRMSTPRGTGRDFGYSDYGTVSGGYPAYGSAEFPADQPPAAAQQAQAEEQAPARQQPAEAEQAEEGQQAESQQQANGEEEAEGEAFAVSEGFFFDNFTSGTGFGVYGGEAVSSGPGSPLILPSAGNRAQELGFPNGPGAGTPPAGGGQGPDVGGDPEG